QEQTEREIAAVYGLSQNAVNKRRKRVLDKLRELIKDF
ncbi:sigma factor-like helix-turn-helix DNA-binding protein, partial [Hungatella effluvii]